MSDKHWLVQAPEDHIVFAVFSEERAEYYRNAGPVGWAYTVTGPYIALEDVRSLWEAAQRSARVAAEARGATLPAALDAFPAPEDWRNDNA